MKIIYCPACGRALSSHAEFCPACGHPMSRRTSEFVVTDRVQPYRQFRQQLWSPGIAAVLSFFIPGLGQLYKRQIFSALLWFVFVPLGYFFLVIPGIILHFFCIVGAAMGDPTRYRGI